MKYYRTPSQVDTLRRDYINEIRRIENMLEDETDLKRRACLQEILVENKEALNNLDVFLNENPSIFK